MLKSRTPAAPIDLFADDPIVSSVAPAATLEVVEEIESAPQAATPQVAPASSNPFAVVLKENNLAIENAEFLTVSFEPLLQQAKQWAAKVDHLVKPGVEPTVSEQKAIKETRVALKKIRNTADKARENLKADGLRRNNAIQGAFNIIKFLTEPLEEKLLAAEQFAERRETERKDAVGATRLAEIAPFTQGSDNSSYNLREMPDDIYANLVVTLRTTHEAKIALAEKAEADRLAKEKAEKDEQDRIRAENDRLRKEAADAKAAKDIADTKAKAERDKLAADAAKKLADERAKAKADADAAAAVAKKAKDAADAIALKERQAREKAEAEIAKVKAAEAKRVADLAAAQKRAAKAPDQQKVRTWAEEIGAVTIPTLTSPEGIELRETIVEQMAKFTTWLKEEAEKL